MPVKKHNNKKNAPRQERDSAIVPQKEKIHRNQIKKGDSKKVISQRVNSLSSSGRKKKPV